MKTKRKNAVRWMQNRLRRLKHKITHESAWGPNGFREIPMSELDRCRKRVREISDTLHAIWKTPIASPRRSNAASETRRTGLPPSP